MRIWSLHPRYLDTKGLVALWRETLLARKVLQGATRGYRHHPQLHRFRDNPDPVATVDRYLLSVWQEACQRGYRFDRSKFNPPPGPAALPGPELAPAAPRPPALTVSSGQLAWEWQHLLAKLSLRDPARHACLAAQAPQCEPHQAAPDPANGWLPEPHPLFQVVPGGVADWEITG